MFRCELIQTLINNLQRFINFLDTDIGPVPAIASLSHFTLAYWNIEIQFRIDRVAIDFAQIETQA